MITFMIGDVTRNNAAAQIGDIIKEKDVIQTGSESFCDIKVGDSLIRVKQKTKVAMSTLLRSGGLDNTAIELDSGKILCKPKMLMKSETFMVRTRTAVAGVRGTQFTVETDANDTSRIKVFEGKVKVATRVRGLDNSMGKILEMAPDVTRDEKVVITKEDAEKAERAVSKIMKSEQGKGGEAMIDAVIKKAGEKLVVGRKKVEKFALKDFEKDNREIIEIKQKPVEVIKEISRAIEEEKEAPRPNGRLLVTRFEVYFIKNGKVEWEGKVVEEPVRQGDKLYVASGEYVYCASVDGPVLWRKQVPNQGKLQVREDVLVVPSDAGESKLDLRTGESR
jgi:hypothetical protein